MISALIQGFSNYGLQPKVGLWLQVPDFALCRGSQLYFLAGHEESKTAQRLAPASQMNTIFYNVSVYFESGQGPNMNYRLAGRIWPTSHAII